MIVVWIVVALWVLSACGALGIWGSRKTRALRVAEAEANQVSLAAFEDRVRARFEEQQQEWLDSQQATKGWFEQVLKQRILVHTVAGKSFDGLLGEVVPDGIVLQQVKMLNGADGLSLVGGVFVPRDQVLFTQMVD